MESDNLGVKIMSDIINTKFGKARKDKRGYYRIFEYKSKYYGKQLHRLIFEDFYQIELPNDVIIHHEDENKTNNEIWNLVPMTRAEHNRIHAKEHTHDCKIRMSQSKNTSGYYRVYKSYEPSLKQGFRYRYRYFVNNKQKLISSTNLETLKEKVLAEGLEWREI